MAHDPSLSSGQPNTADDAQPTDAPNAPPAEASASRQVGRYQLGADLPGGERLARDRLLDRTVRVRTADAAQADDLEQEARFLARLEHAGIACVYDVVRGDGGALLVSRNLEGIVLASAIQDACGGTIRAELATPAATMRVFVRVCDALAAAHARGVVHRALTPEAIFLGLHGEVLVGNWRTAMIAHERPATLRYVADLRPTQAHELDDLHTDIRAVGRCLFEALSLVPLPREALAADRLLEATDPNRVPPRAISIIRRAIASDKVNGYRSASEIGADLELAASQIAAGNAPRIRWSPPPSRRRLLLAAALGLVLGGAAVYAAVSSMTPSVAPTGWQSPILTEKFDDSEWRNRWAANSDNAWEHREGRLVSAAAKDALLIYRQRLTPPVAIEYTGEILPGERPCDLSVFWSEREGSALDPANFLKDARSWQIQAGSNDNQFCAIFRNPGQQRVAYNPLQLQPGRSYRFRVEIDGEIMRMLIDGAEVLRYRDRFPTTSGFIALYSFYPGKAFDDVAIWQRSAGSLVPATAMGDALLSFGHPLDAAAAYARIVEGASAESQQALFRKGLAERRAGRNDLARETWSRLLDPELSQVADALRLEDLFATGQHDLFRERIVTYWRRHPGGHEELRQQWQFAVAALIADPRTEPSLVERYLAIRDELFRDDKATMYEAANALLYLHRYDEVLRFHQEEKRACIRALIALGRTTEAEKLPGLSLAAVAQIRQMRADYQRMIDDPETPPYHRAYYLCKLGRAATVTDPLYRAHPAMLYLGRAEELLAVRPLSGGVAREALIAVGRLAEAAGNGLPDVPDSGNDWRAMLLLGRIDEAMKVRGYGLEWAQALRAQEAGDTALVAKLRPYLVWPRDLGVDRGWFEGLVIAPMLDRLAGDAEAPARALRRAASEWSGVFGKRAWYFAKAVLGEIPDQEVLSMPTQSEAEAWRRLAVAVRLDLAGDAAAAAAAYGAFRTLPSHQRLLEANTLDTQVELFAAWRQRALGR